MPLNSVLQNKVIFTSATFKNKENSAHEQSLSYFSTDIVIACKQCLICVDQLAHSSAQMNNLKCKYEKFCTIQA